MKAANILILCLAVTALSGCDAYDVAQKSMDPIGGDTVEFVSADPAKVVIDVGATPAGELQYASAMAKDKCAFFHKYSAILQSLKPLYGDRSRATFECR